jgi:hypothetical protein
MKIIKEYLLENYEPEEINDMAKYGCSGGVGGFIYYSETCAFHDEHENEIWDLLESMREDSGHKTILELIATFNGSKDVGSMDQFKNMLCWVVVEHFAQEIVGERE